MYIVSRKHLKEEDVRLLLDSLDPSFALRLQETVDLVTYSHKLASYANFELAESRGNIVGIIAFYTNTETSNLYIPYVCVHSAYRRKGIADALMIDLCTYADSQKAEISLEVRKDNLSAIRLYEKFGFQVVKDSGTKFYMTRKWTSKVSY